MDRQLLRQKVHQKISVIKTNSCDDITKIVHFGIFLIHVFLKTSPKLKETFDLTVTRGTLWFDKI